MNNTKSISFFCPAFNEEDNLEKAVSSVLPVLKNISDVFEIIVIDNCSTDRTPEIADRLSRDIPQLRVIHNKVNKGYGGALMTGFRAAVNEVVVYTDSDNQYDFNELRGLVPNLDNYDIVIGYRLKRHDSVYRLLQSAIFNALVNMLFGIKFRDINCSFKVYKKEVLDSIDIHSKSAFIDAEILIKALDRGYRIVEVPVTHFKRLAGKSSGARPGMVFTTIQEIISFWCSRLNSKKSGGSA